MNLISTSINIEKCRLEKFKAAAKKLKISETELLSLLLEKSSRLCGNSAITKQTVKYQRDIDVSDYVIEHVNFVDVDYEYATGRRYLFKISVSFLFRLAIDAFLTEIINEWTQKTEKVKEAREAYITNIHYLFFEIIHYIKNGSEFWLIPWPK